MPKIERRRATVKLYHGHYQQALADLVDQAAAALRDEESGATPQRQGTKSKATKLALEYDALAKEAEETATIVTLYALRFDEADDLREEHPPREDDARDLNYGVNMKTYLPALVRCALVPPGEAEDFEDLKIKGAAALIELDLSRVNYSKLETAAWNVNAGDDEIPKDSLSSLIKRAREPDSKQPNDSESAQPSSRGTSRPKRTRTTTPKATSPEPRSSTASPSGTTAPDPAP